MADWTKAPAGDINAAMQRLWGAFGDKASEVAARIKSDPNLAECIAAVATNSDPGFAQRVAQFVKSGGYEPTASHEMARRILGRRLFGVEGMMKVYDYVPTRAQTLALSEIPWSPEELEATKGTHAYAAVFPVSIAYLEERYNRLWRGGWESFRNACSPAFSAQTGEAHWVSISIKDQTCWDADLKKCPTTRDALYVLLADLRLPGTGDCFVTGDGERFVQIPCREGMKVSYMRSAHGSSISVEKL